MKSNIFLPLLSLAALAAASPAKRDGPPPTDVDILNYALTLEHLEAAFYREALQKYSQQDFVNAGYPSWIRGRYSQIGEHEKSHVDFLESALGDKAVKACEYKFPYADIKSFVALSNTLESVGTSAYTGAAKFLENKGTLTAAATILTVEARHAAWISSAARKGAAWGGPFDTPLDLSQVYTIASGLIVSCPSGNAPLPVHAFPKLTITRPTSAKTFVFSFPAPTGADANKPLYAGFIFGVIPKITPLKYNRGKWEADIPDGLLGYGFVIVTRDAASVSDAATVAGPAVLEIRFDSMNQML